MLQFFFNRVGNLVGNGENVGYQHFLLFPRCFQTASRAVKGQHFAVKVLRLIDWLNGVLCPFQQYFNYINGHSSHYSCLSWVSPVLGQGSLVSCPRTLPQKSQKDPVQVEPMTPALQVKHFTTEP